MTPETLTFAEPMLAWLALPVVVLLAVGVAQWRQVRALLGKLSGQPNAPQQALRRVLANWQAGRSLARRLLVGVALLLLVVAATRPRYGMRETEVANAGIDIAVVVDASKSMLVKDILPNRLQGTALEVSALLGKLAGGRVALVPFAGIAFVQCPLTTDHEVVRTYLQDLRPDDVPVGGTNIGRALTLAIDVLTGQKERLEAEAKDNLIPQFAGSKNKAIVLFSDGEDHEGAALEAAQKAKDAGIQVFTVGVGSSFGDPVPVLGPDGNAIGVMKDEAGNPVFSKLNLELLQQIASVTGGKTFRYQNKSVADELWKALDALEKAEYQARFATLGEDRFQWLLGPALLLLLLEMWLGNRRKVPQRSPSRAPQSPGKVATAAVLLPLLALGQAWALPSAEATPAWLQRENPDVADGREALTAGDPKAAKEAFAQAQASRPEHAILWYDLALAQATAQSWDDALQSLQRALSALGQREPALEADIHFATGTVHLLFAQQLEKAAPPPQPSQSPQPSQAPAEPPPGGQPPAPPPPPAGPPKEVVEHYKQAVQALETALLLQPERTDVARNLELARMGAWPPCSSRDKQDEPNNEPKQAKPLDFSASRESSLNLRLCREDRDVYGVALQPGDRLQVEVETTAETGPSEDEGNPTKPQLALALLGDDGQTVLTGSTPGNPPQTKLTLGDVKTATQAFVDVRNAAEVETPYVLKTKLLPACPRTEDKFEPNNDLPSARSLPVGEPQQARLCPNNPDLFAVPLQEGQGLGIEIEAKVDLGAPELTVEVVGPGGQVLAATAPGGQKQLKQKLRMARAFVAGNYAVRVQGGADTEADYTLALTVLPPCGERDDPFEDNDQALQGNPLGPDQLSKPLQGLQLCPGDDDWYTVELKAGESLFADLTAPLQDVADMAPLAGNVTVEVYDDAGVIWGKAIGSAVSGEGAVARTVQVLAPPPGKYRIRVTGGGVSAPRFPLPALPPQPEDAAAASGPGSGSGSGPGSGPGSGSGSGSGPGPGPGAGPGADPAAAAPAPPRIVLPAGFPRPAVDAGQARVDLPYNLQLRILPPCPAGNDEQEPNETAGAAKEVQVGAEQLLRICKDDHDWLQVTQKAGQSLQISARYDHGPGDLTITATDEGGQKVLAEGETQAPDTEPTAGKQDTPAARQGRTALTGLRLPEPKADRIVKLHVRAAAGVENFYVLRIEEPPPPSDQGQNQQEPDPQEQNDDDKKDEDQKQDQKDQQGKDQKPKPDQPDPADKQEQEQRRRQMERSDHNPTNLEAQEALRNSPLRNQQPTKDW